MLGVSKRGDDGVGRAGRASRTSPRPRYERERGPASAPTPFNPCGKSAAPFGRRPMERLVHARSFGMARNPLRRHRCGHHHRRRRRLAPVRRRDRAGGRPRPRGRRRHRRRLCFPLRRPPRRHTSITRLREAAEATLDRVCEPLSDLPVQRLAVADASAARALFATALARRCSADRRRLQQEGRVRQCASRRHRLATAAGSTVRSRHRTAGTPAACAPTRPTRRSRFRRLTRRV